MGIFFLGLGLNYYHDDILREIRRKENARQERIAKESGSVAKKVEKHYEIPEEGLFKYMLYPQPSPSKTSPHTTSSHSQPAATSP